MFPPLSKDRPSRRRVGGLLAVTLASSPLLLHGQSLPNPDFGANSFNGTVAANAAITGWTTTTPTLVGLNAHADNGVTEAPNVAFLMPGGNLKTVATGLTIGTRYNVSFSVNASLEGYPSEALPLLSFSTNAAATPVNVTSAKISNVGANAYYKQVAFEFVATGTTQELTISNLRTSGNHILLATALSIHASAGTWSITPWTNDTDSGISSDYAYTHALNFAFSSGVTVNGVPFVGSTTTNTGITPRDVEYDVPGRVTIAPLGGTSNVAAPSLTGSCIDLARNLKGGNLTFSLSNLKPNTAYVASFYTVGLDAAGSEEQYRSATFNSLETSEKLTINQNTYGQFKGLIVRYNYTSDSAGTATIMMSTLGTAPRLGAFSNRAAATFTGTSGWTSAAWNDDASSGIDAHYHYTHAYNFNASESTTINAVTFRGLSGTNPSDEPNFYTNRLNGLTNDTNNITGGSADLAHTSYSNNTPNVFILNGLIAGKEYVASLYSVGIDTTRPILFSGTAGGKQTVINQGQYGVDNGIRMDYRYVAPPSGTVVLSASAFDGNKLFSAYALSNREAQPQPAAPQITFHPQGGSIAAGSDYTLDVTATGNATLTYQWLFNGNVIPGATAGSYTITNAGPENTGNYSVKVTNGSGQITSNPATISVIEGIPGFYNTGVGWDGASLWDGSPGAIVVDPHYTLIQNPNQPGSTEAYVVTSHQPIEWLNSGNNFKWIAPASDPGGTAAAVETPYAYRLSFALPGFDPDSIVITGNWASDNYDAGILVNGVVVVGPTYTTGFSAFASFRIDAELLAQSGAVLHTDGQMNTLDFMVRNETSGPSGLIVKDLTGLGNVASGTAPVVIEDPAATSAAVGDTVTFGVVASGSGRVGYQWQKDGVNIAGATLRYLTLPVTGTGDAGDYRVVVTNGSGSATSGSATLTVTGGTVSTPPSDLILTRSGGSVGGSFTGTPGKSYTLQRSTTLAAGDWVDIQTVIAPANGVVSMSDAAPPTVRAFYRISYQP